MQYRYLGALSRLLTKISGLEGDAGPAHRELYDPVVLLSTAVELLGSPVREVQTAAAQLVSVLLEVLGTLNDHNLAIRILQQLLAMTEERSVSLPTLASQCIAKLVEIPSVAAAFSEGGRLRPVRAKCVECLARAC